jgi:RNA polymerase sigma factor (sigma-70 family)
MNEIKANVFVVDDDEDIRRSLKWLLEKEGYEVHLHASADAFLRVYDPNEAGCILLDIRMPGMDGLELQQTLVNRGHSSPIIIVSGHADIPIAVKAVQAGALDVIEKPFNRVRLLEQIEQAVQKDQELRARRQESAAIEERLARLTPREHEVMGYVIRGKTAREIGEDLDLSSRTVEKHRERVMKKMEVDSTAELLLLLAARRGLLLDKDIATSR